MKSVLITGCSSGYGRATALYFHERGWNVVATARSPGTADLPLSDRMRVLRLDVTDRASIREAVNGTIDAFGALDVVVNNAGIGLLSAFEATPEETIRDLFETNTFGVMAVTQTVIPHFRARRTGVIVNVTSSVGIVPMPLVSVYTASKHAIEGFTEALSYELGLVGARAKLVEPGYGPSTRFAQNGAERMEGLLPETYAAYAETLMRGMSGAKTTVAQDVAEAVWRAATDGSRRLRYPAGADAEDLAAMRRAFPGEDYLAQMHAILGPTGGDAEDVG